MHKLVYGEVALFNDIGVVCYISFSAEKIISVQWVSHLFQGYDDDTNEETTSNIPVCIPSFKSFKVWNFEEIVLEKDFEIQKIFKPTFYWQNNENFGFLSRAFRSVIPTVFFNFLPGICFLSTNFFHEYILSTRQLCMMHIRKDFFKFW